MIEVQIFLYEEAKNNIIIPHLKSIINEGLIIKIKVEKV